VVRLLRRDCTTQSMMIVLIFVALPVLMTIFFISFNSKLYSIFRDLCDVFDRNRLLGFFIYSATFLVWVPLTLPSSIMTLGGGYVFAHTFGIIKGYFICAAAIWLGHPFSAFIAFNIGRHFMKQCIQRHLI